MPNALPPELRPNALSLVDPFVGLVAHSPEVLGMAHCLDSPSQSPRPFGAYCFKLNFTPVSVIANAIAHPNDNEFGPILYTAGQTSLDNSRKTKMDVALNARPVSNMQPW